MTPARKIELLSEARLLVESLKQASIFLEKETLGNGDAVATGIPASAVGHLVAFLYRSRDLILFQEFVENLAGLDRLTAQNQQNPRAHHAALREIVLPWLEENGEFLAEEVLYIFAWARRLLPSASVNKKVPVRKPIQVGRRPVKPEKDRVFEVPSDFGGNQLAQQLLAAQQRQKKKPGRK